MEKLGLGPVLSPIWQLSAGAAYLGTSYWGED